ncbi:MAG: response regulator [Clostridia bacterium]
MKIIAADDEMLAREMLEQAIAQACPDAQIFSFSKASEVLQLVEHTTCDVAFLDICMRGMDGMTLATSIKQANPQINIVFVTGYDEYATGAMAMHASGYIMKPVTQEKVLKELGDLRYPMSAGETGLFQAKCFGNFDVYDPMGQPVYFKRSKAKEVLAYLIHRQGATCTIKEIAGVLFENTPYDAKQQGYMQQIIFSMMQTLKQAGAEGVVRKRYNHLSVDIGKLDCDYYRCLKNNAPHPQAFMGEYMSQYAWGEYMVGYLERQMSEDAKKALRL